MAISKFEIIKEKKQWEALLKKVKHYDFYHTYDYHQLAKQSGETPILIQYQDGDLVIGLPFLLRKIFDTSFFDITSVYGYAGPLQYNPQNEPIPKVFQEQLNAFFIQNKIVSVFSRLNPFIPNQENILKGLGEILTLSNVVNIDITQNVDDQRVIFSKTTKRYINKARKLCDIKVGGTAADIEVFIDLYYENMNRVNAKKSYYFDKEYFEKFINSTDFETDVLLATLKETGEIISAAMMVRTHNIIQYHISGTRDKYLHLTPIRILIDEMRIRGTQMGYTYFNLGGGLGSSEDNLFNFKASFSKDFKAFKIWKYIVNPEVYNQLVTQFTHNNSENNHFFPLYRSV